MPAIAQEFTDVVTEIGSRVYAPGREHDPSAGSIPFNKFLNDESCPVIQFLGRRMGCEVTRWYFYDREHDELTPFHKRVKGGIDPLWMEVSGYDPSSGKFDIRCLKPKEKEDLQTEQEKTDATKSAEILYRWFLDGKWLRTQSVT